MNQAAQWEGLSKEEQQRHIRRMHNLTLDPPLSQVARGCVS